MSRFAVSCLSHPHSNRHCRHVVIAPTPTSHCALMCLILTYHTFASLSANISAINYFQASHQPQPQPQPQLQFLDEPHKDQTPGSVARLAVISLVALCDALDSIRHSAALADISKPLTVQCDVTLSLLLQRSTGARSWLLQSNTHEGNTTADANHLEVHKLSTASTCSALSTTK